MTWVIVGCGYTGNALARALANRGEDVVVTRRAADAAARTGDELGVRALAVDLATPVELPAGAIVVCLAPPGEAPAREAENLVAACSRARRLVYVSSTGVYPAGGGARIDETCAPAPVTASGRARLEFERALAACAVSWIALRAAGIHGPGRGLVERIKSGSYRIVGADTNRISRIHVDDVVEAIICAAESSATGVVNLADDDPAPIGLVADTIAAQLGLPPVPRVPVSAVSEEIAGMLAANRAIANERMKRELGVVLRYPSWRALL